MPDEDRTASLQITANVSRKLVFLTCNWKCNKIWSLR